MSNKAIVLDANILIRAVLGKRVRGLIVDNADMVQFFAPDVAYADARKYLPAYSGDRDRSFRFIVTGCAACKSCAAQIV